MGDAIQELQALLHCSLKPAWSAARPHLATAEELLNEFLWEDLSTTAQACLPDGWQVRIGFRSRRDFRLCLAVLCHTCHLTCCTHACTSHQVVAFHSGSNVSNAAAAVCSSVARACMTAACHSCQHAGAAAICCNMFQHATAFAQSMQQSAAYNML